ncbi:MAG: polysaccharide deacetylase family protein [Clostridia bacterium]|nr:polysaccharide deacetylase family protein [Clostridia bacterium]
MRSKLLCILLAIAFICTLICIPVAAQTRISLFIGDDEWNNDSLMPFIESEGKKLVPAEVFGEFDGIKVSSSDSLGSLLIERGEEYISYNLNFGTYIDNDGIVKKADIYSYGGALYLEPQAVCERFDLKFETAFAQDGYLAARITDGSEELSFETLLSYHANSGEVEIPYLYNPTGKTVAGLFMYPYMLLPSPQNVEDILPLLGRHNVTFALLPKNIKTYAASIAKIYASGHTIAYYMNWAGESNPEAFRAEMEAANEFLFAYIGKTSRVYISPETYRYIPKIEGYFAKSCQTNLVADDLTDDRAVNMALIDSPAALKFNFSLASDYHTRINYRAFFRKFDSFTELRSMTANEATSTD